MKPKFLLVIISLIISSNYAFNQSPINIIPQPVSIKMDNKLSFNFNENTKIVVNTDGKEYSVAEYLHSKLKDFNPDIKPIYAKRENPKYNIANSIILIPTSNKKIGTEGYEMDITQDKIIIMANENQGFFYACQTLIQMLMSATKDGSSLILPSCKIIDYPRFSYRGKHLDCSRHFFTPTEIKEYIDILAFHKLNTFHWHLTDDQGWRIEIEKYPKLQEIASKRKETLIGHYSDEPQRYDGKEYGGFYTQEEIKDIVNYAKERYITIIPEIEMPGHSRAVLAAYPNLGCKSDKVETGTTWGIFEDVFCNKEDVFIFLQDVLDEVISLFPSQYIHIGGDECPKTNWKTCPICQKAIKDNSLKDEYELQSYFMNRIEKYLESKGKKVIGWDEILEGGLKGKATIMSWQGEAGGIAAAKNGHDAIMSPAGTLYFDYYQGSAEQEPLAIGGFTSLKKVYQYEPIPKELTLEESKHIIGVQANTWTEYIPTFKKVQYMDLPRIAALSEIAWTKPENKNYTAFLKRLDTEIERYDKLGYNYALSHYSIEASTSWDNKKREVKVVLVSPMQKAEIYYTTDGSIPTKSSKKYRFPIILKKNTDINALAISDDGKKSSPLFHQYYTLNRATGKKYKMANINPQYSGNSAYPLTDGLFGTRQGYDRWLGTLGNDYNVELDLEEASTINHISINFLDEKGSWIFAPIEVSFYISKDAKKWEKINTLLTKDIKPKDAIYTYSSEVKTKSSVRYIRIEAKAIKTCPQGHSGYGYPAHCFADEIIIE